MRTGKTIRPGRPGTARWVNAFGDRLIAVRYRYDSNRQMRYTTVELVVDSCPWIKGEMFPRGADPDRLRPEVVFVKAAFGEQALRARIKAAGGRWDATRRAWELRFEQVIRLGLRGRIQFLTDRAPQTHARPTGDPPSQTKTQRPTVPTGAKIGPVR